MRDRDGREVLENGNFVAGHDRWFFTNDLHVHWHAKSLWVHLLVEQGWLCLLTFMALCAYAFHRLRRARNNPMSVILRASLAGCLVVGITDSILDSPKIAFMFCLLIIMAIQVRPLKISANTGRGNRHYRGT